MLMAPNMLGNNSLSPFPATKFVPMNHSLLKKFASVLGLAAVLAAANTASALVINIGGDPKTGTGPTIASNSITLSFAQNGANTVRLTLTAGPDAIKVDAVYFNVDRSVTFVTPVVSGVTATFAYASNSYGPNGGSPALTGFDVKVEYGQSGANGAFFNGQSTVVDITGSGLTPSSFNFTAANGYLAAAHINKPLGGNDSGKYVNAVPPGNTGLVPDGGWTLALLGFALSGVVLLSRRSNFRE